MRITVDERLYAQAFDILGRVGEREYREISCTFPSVEGAQFYKLRFELSHDCCYELDITSGSAQVPYSLLVRAGFVKAQFIATSLKTNGDYDIIAKSNVFYCVVGPSIDAQVEPVPTYEEAKGALEDIKSYLDKFQLRTAKLTYDEYCGLEHPDPQTVYYVVKDDTLLIYLGSIPLISGGSSYDIPADVLYKQHSGEIDTYGKPNYEGEE